MKKSTLILKLVTAVTLFGIVHYSSAQTNTVTSGTWNDPTIWSTGVVPGPTTTVNVNHPVEINTNISITTGTYTFNASATDFTGGTDYALNISGGSITVNSSATVVFNAASTITDGTITVNSGGTLILYAPSTADGFDLPNDASLDFFINGRLIIYGNIRNRNNSGDFVVNGIVELRPKPGCGVCAGNFINDTGSITIGGSGDLQTSGALTNQGGSTTFGSSNDCAGPGCSGQSLCAGSGSSNVISTGDQYLCSGGTAGSLNADAVSGATYEWQASTTSATSGFVAVGVATEDYNPGTPSQTTWYRRGITGVAGCSGTRFSLPVIIAIINSGSWRGTTSTDWHTASNWCGSSIPTATTDVVLVEGLTNYPIVSSANAVCRNLTLDLFTTLTVNAGRTLSVGGNIGNSGTLNVSGTIEFNGTSAQTITGNGSGLYSNVTFNNTSGASPAVTIPAAGLNVSNQLTLTSGVINLNGSNLTIGTAAGSAGSLSYTAGRLYNGNLTRWFATGALTIGSGTGHFPIGTITDYRPIFFGNSNITTGGTIRVNHTGTAGFSTVSFNDSDGPTPVVSRSNSFWTVATGNGLATANNFAVRTEGTGIGTFNAVSQIRLTQASAAAFGTMGTNGGTVSNPQVNRTGVSTTNLNNNYYWATTIGNYTWNGSVSTDWTVANNWTPSRTTPASTDVLTFNATGTNRNITNVPIQTVGSILVTGSTTYSFAPSAGGNNLSLSLTTGNALQIDNGSTLTIGTVGNALNINAPTGGQVEIGGQLNLANGNLGAGGVTVTLHTNSAPLARTSGQVSLDGSSSLRFGNASNTTGATIVLPNNIFVASPTLVGTLIVNRTNGATLGNQALQIQTSATFTLGDLNTNAAGLPIFLSTSSAPVETDLSKIVGSAEMDFRTVGTGGLNFLGVNVPAGTDDIGSIRVQRRTGPDGVNTFNANESIAATWIISRVGGVEPSAGRNIQFSWLADFDNSRPVTNQFQVYRFNSGPGWTAVGALQALAATSPQRQTAAVSVTDITDTFTVTDQSQILPVELLFFSAASEKNSVLTSWATATERNTDYFLIERSTDGESFLPLGQVKAVGNSRQRNNYQLEDSSPWIGRAYYRLTSVDFDGFRESFRVQVVDFAGERSARLFPNPVENRELNVQLSFTPERFYGVVITDTKGVELLRTQTTEPRITLPLDVPPGVYIVRVAGDAFQQVSKIVVR
jgi:hypothetical protein